MIRMILVDIDGVLTDGKFSVGTENNISKQLCFKDLDAIVSMKNNGYKIGIITGENDFFTQYISQKTALDFFEEGCKNKKQALLKIADRAGCSLDEICYIGDGKYDIEALESAGLSVCPKDAIDEVKKISDVILKRKGGEGCLAELATYLSARTEEKKQTSQEQIPIANILQEHVELADRLLQDIKLQAAIEQAILVIVEAMRAGGQLLLCGNGGSAADAQHIATELVSRFYMERPGLNAEALTVNTSSLTAIGNDYSYERIFARQVEAKGKHTDVLIGISTSGCSANVLEAFRVAKKIGMKTIAFVGKNDLMVQGLADVIIAVPSENTPRIQEMHIMIGHIICEYVEKLMFQSGSEE